MVRRAFTVDEWHRMGDAGLFVGETRRTELFDGEILEMAAVGSRHAVCVNMISEHGGKLVGYPRLPELQALESYHDVLLKVRPGGELKRTVNDMTYPMLVHLLNEVEGVLTHDYMTARYLDGEGFYDVA